MDLRGNMCCEECRNAPAGIRSAVPSSSRTVPPSSSPFSLDNLLPAGIIAIDAVTHLDAYGCEHSRLEDGWHRLRQLYQFISCGDIGSEDRQLILDMEFLQTHEFISTSCSLIPSTRRLVFRIYLIPHDLPNVQGRLRHRHDTKVLTPARKILRRLLPLIDQDSDVWSGVASNSSTRKPILPNRPDGRTMAEIYGDLPSPVIPDAINNPAYSDLVETIISSDLFPGMRSPLFPYQRRSIVAMLEKERLGRIVQDPLYIPLSGMDHKVYYYQPGTMELLRDCPMNSQNQGGILCEELGTGKTVMILALILATLEILPSPIKSLGDEQRVFTPLSVRQFPIHASKFSQLSKCKSRVIAPPCPSSLVENLLHFIRVSPSGLGLTEYQQQLEQRSLWDPLLSNTPFFLARDVDINDGEPPRRLKRHVKRKVMYLTAATLVIVPPNLLAQWQSEVLKHIEVSLRVFVLKSDNDLPPAQRLASDYDIVLMTNNRFSQEASLLGTETTDAGYNCHCAEFHNVHVPRCSCPKVDLLSPLHQIRWKRLVLDEGHNSATNTTNFIHLSKMLSVERRWIVTGTPTSNLLGLSFGQETDDGAATHSHDQPQSHISSAANSLGAESDSQSHGSPSTIELTGNEKSTNNVSRVWTKYDREDLRKLANMMIHFLQVPRFAAEPSAFNVQVTEPLLSRQGPHPGAIQVLGQVMSNVMVRHRIEDVEKDVILPPMKQENVLLELDTYAVNTYNVQQALIAINAIDSERTDQDYLFHPRNSHLVKQTIENMSQILFWHVDEDTFNRELAEVIHRAEDAITRVTIRKQSDSDIELARKTLHHLRHAAADQLWRDMQGVWEVPYRLSHLPESLIHAWRSFSFSSERYLFMTPGRILALRTAVISKPLMSLEHLADYASVVIKEERAREAFSNARLALSKAGRKSGRRDVLLKVQANRIRTAVNSEDKLDELRREYVKAQEKLKVGLQMDGGSDHFNESVPIVIQNDRVSSLLSFSPLAKSKIGSSVSSKLNYILKEVLQFSATEKFLIFSKLPFTLAHIEEGLELAGVKFLRFTTDVPQRVREQYVTTFETSDMYRVFLMELKHGARGLNLISASRVIFCEPVWQADVESQAIKRAHRIGQTRAITVKTLAIKSSFEEVMLSRRVTLKGGSGKVPGMEEETGIRDFLKNPMFMEPSIDIQDVLSMPILPIPPDDMHNRSDDLLVFGDSRGDSAASSLKITIPAKKDRYSESPKKRVKLQSVRFAD